jgi:MFS family permease
MLDAMDMMLFSMVVAHLMVALDFDRRQAGLLNSLTLVASALGGFLFGFVADRVGRRRALMASILVYSAASGLCALSSGLSDLRVYRFLLGLGMGGEWTTGAALVAETWRPEHRGKALGLMQSTWAIGEMLAAGIAGLLLPNWRAVFLFGVLPALLVLWVRRGVPESELWEKRARAPGPLAPGVLRNGLVATAMNALSMFGYWGLFTWIPAYLSLPVEKGGRGLSVLATTLWLLVMGVGKWLGYALFGFFADRAGRRLVYGLYLAIAGLLVPLFGYARAPLALLLLGPLVAFFGTGYFSGFSAIAAEIFPTPIRATAMGISYNIGRGLSALAPFAIGVLSAERGLGPAFLLVSGAFFGAALLCLFLPETRGVALT